ncbi:MAG: hypothetical protein LBM77_04215 [Spirochaetaceae bacterium]|jgi:hypothetical protein|nr:hypothetical protein [Spirochaetaceae bacterium]
MKVLFLVFLLIPAGLYAQSAGIPQALLRPNQSEAPRYPADTVIGELGQGQANAESFTSAKKILDDLMQGKTPETIKTEETTKLEETTKTEETTKIEETTETGDTTKIEETTETADTTKTEETTKIEDATKTDEITETEKTDETKRAETITEPDTALKEVAPKSYRIGGGRIEDDGSISFLVRFIGEQLAVTAELYLLPETYEFDEIIFDEPKDAHGGEYKFDFSPYERWR